MAASILLCNAAIHMFINSAVSDCRMCDLFVWMIRKHEIIRYLRNGNNWTNKYTHTWWVKWLRSKIVDPNRLLAALCICVDLPPSPSVHRCRSVSCELDEWKGHCRYSVVASRAVSKILLHSPIKQLIITKVKPATIPRFKTFRCSLEQIAFELIAMCGMWWIVGIIRWWRCHEIIDKCANAHMTILHCLLQLTRVRSHDGDLIEWQSRQGRQWNMSFVIYCVALFLVAYWWRSPFTHLVT